MTVRAYSYVRMSTDEQLKGDSLRRQLELSRTFCEQHGLELTEEFDLRDIGVSAFKGANAAAGALHRFMEAVRSKRIEAGSYLLVESLDRLSRQEARTAFSLFNEIIEAGIKIATLGDGRVYEKDNTDFGELIYSLAIMSRAHDESRIKSQRGAAAWEGKRRHIQAQKLTSLCPAWLSLSQNKTEFIIDSVRADVVRAMFEDSAAGIGNYSIARRLNERGVKPFGRSRGWQVSSVQKILTNRAVIGEFQPHRIADGIRTPDGPPISSYFPSIVDEDLFYRTQQARRVRQRGGGRKGKFISNVFSGLATCAYCGAKMHFINKGSGPKGGTYLICDTANRGLGCKRVAWRYEEFESSFFAFVQEIDLEQLARTDAEGRLRTDLDQRINALEGQQHALEQRRDRIFEMIDSDANPIRFVRDKLIQCQQELARVEAELGEKKKQLDQLQVEASLFYESKSKIQALIAKLQQRDGDDVYALRAQVASKLRSIVTAVVVAPAGTAPSTERTLEFVRERVRPYGEDRQDDELADLFQDQAKRQRAHRRYFGVQFNDGRTRVVYPSGDNPLAYDEQIVSDSENLAGWRTIASD